MDASFADQSVQEVVDSHYSMVKIDIAKFPGCTSQYGIDTVPRLIVFDAGGNVRDSHVGGMEPAELKAFLQKAVTSVAAPTGIHPDLAAQMTAANAAGKKLLVDFHGDSGDIYAMMDEVRDDPAVKDILAKSFQYCKLDIGHFDRHAGCLSRYKVERMPTLIGFGSDGSEISRYDSPPNPATFKAFLLALLKPKGLAIYRLQELPAGKNPVASALTRAGAENRRLIVYFYAKNTKEHTEVETSIGNAGSNGIMTKFALLRIEAATHADLAKHYGCSKVPYVAIFDGKGKVSSYFDKPMTAQKLIAGLVSCEH